MEKDETKNTSSRSYQARGKGRTEARNRPQEHCTRGSLLTEVSEVVLETDKETEETVPRHSLFRDWSKRRSKARGTESAKQSNESA